MMSLVITIVVIIIIAMITMSAGGRMPDEANYANFAEEVKNVEEGVQRARLNNAYKGDTEERINAGFKKVTLKNAPDEFQSFDTTGITVTGYVVDLGKIKYENAEFGKEYEIETSELEFKQDDVYVYDSTGTVFYVKGIYYQDEIIHRPFSDSVSGSTSSEDGPIISNIVISSGELADGTLTSAKAKLTISAFPRYGGKLTVMVRELIAEEQADGTFTTQVSRNGVYTVIATEENGGRTVKKVNVTGIVETNSLPSNLSMIVNNGDPNVRTNMVDIVLRADGANKMIIAKNNPLKPTSSDTRWEDYKTNFTYDLGTQEGRITLYAWFKNEYSNVTDQIVKASIIYDRTAPSSDAPTLTVSGPYVIVESNQKDNVSPDTYLLSKTEYGYRIHDGALASESDYDWSTGKLIGPLVNGETYDFVTRTEDEVGNKSTSVVKSQKIKFDYLINFDLNGATGTIDSVYAEAGTSIQVPGVDVVRSGYRFVGWSERKDATVDDVAEIILENENYLPTGNDTVKTLYAIWAPRTDMKYTVNHYVEKVGSIGDYELKLTEVFNDGKVGDLAWAKAKTDGAFYGFVENESHSQRVGMAEIKGDGSTVLSLYYYRAKFTLTVKGENATATGTTVEVPYETEVTISATPTEGFEFDRWVIEGTEETSLEYANFVNENGNKNVNATFKMPARDITLIAKTKLKKYKITYNLNDGTATGENPTEYDRNTPAFTLYNPIKTGYNFAGWTGTGLTTTTLNVTLDPATLVNMVDREYEALFTPSEDLLTITATPTEPTNGNVRAIVACLDNKLRIEYRVGTTGTWDVYTSSIEIEENTVVYARAIKNGNIIDEESLAITNIDKENPIIKDIKVSESWKSGNKMLIDIEATDNIQILGYAITDSESVPAKDEFKKSNTGLKLSDEVNYVWVMDTAENTTHQAVYAWDISKEQDKGIYALLKNEKEMIIVGTGETASYTETNTPFQQYKEKVTDVTIQGNVESIGSYVLADMENVARITISKALTRLEENAIARTNNYENITIEKGNQNFVYNGYTLYNSDVTEIYSHSRIDAKEEYTINSAVEKINNYAFYKNDNLSLINSNSNPTLGDNVFENCNELYQISGEIGGTSIGKEAFLHCENLHLLELSINITTIGEGAFAHTYKLGVVIIPKTVTKVASADTSINGVFEHIGIYSENIYNKGIVKYYQSCKAMYDYAHKYSTEAHFEMIDDIKPEIVSLNITSPESGTYSQGNAIEFTATFSEELAITESKVPELTIRIGEEGLKTVDYGYVSGDKIIYVYYVNEDDFGEISLSSYKGIVEDLAGNQSEVEITEMGGSTIYINTVACLIEGDEASYYSSIQNALNAMQTLEGNITLLKDTDESITIKGNTNVSINLNSNTLNNTSDNTTITNNGVLNVFDGYINSNGTAIKNNANSKLEIYNLEIEVAGENQTAISTEESITSIYDSTIKGNQMLIDATGSLVLNSSTLTTKNGPAIKVNANTLVTATASEITSNNGYGINISNTGTAELTNTHITATKGTAINNVGTLNVYESTLIVGAVGINTSGTVNFNNGIIEGTDSEKSVVDNSGTFVIYEGTIYSNVGVAVQNRAGTFNATNSSITTTGTNKDAFNNMLGATLEFASGDISSKDGYALTNSGTATIKTGSNLTSNGIGVIENKSILNATSATITSVSSTSKAIINTGTYEDTNSTIATTGTVGIENKNNSSLILDGTKITVNNTLSNATGITTSSRNEVRILDITMNVDSTAGTSTGIKLEENSIVNIFDGDINATTNGSTGYGINNYKGTLTLGVNNEVISKTQPSIEGTTYGYYSTSGVLNYYDGRFIGEEEKSIVGNVTDQPVDTFLLFNLVDDREHSELAYDIWGPTDVTLEADKTYWTNETIILTGKASDEGSGIWKYAITNSPDEPKENEWIELEEKTLEFEITKEINEWDTFYLHVMDGSYNYAVSNPVETKYDNTAPSIIKITSNPNGWTSGDVLVNVEYEDTASGIVEYEFTTNYHDIATKGEKAIIVSPTNSGTLSYTATENEKIYIYLKDQAGNVTCEEYDINNIDKTAPTINVEFVEYGDTYVKVKVDIIDNGSGIKNVKVDGTLQSFTGTDYEKSITLEISKAGITSIEVQDNVSNVSTENIYTYSIIYDSVNATGSMPTQIKLKDKDITILENRFEKESYSFINWNTKKDYTGTEYLGGDTYTANEDVILYARWKDVEAPRIIDIHLPEEGAIANNNNYYLEIDATDNIAVTGYGITQTNEAPISWSESNKVSAQLLTSDTWYVWTKDAEGNMTSTEIKVYDISDTNSTTFGILKDIDGNGEYTLSIECRGTTKDFGAKEEKPWKNYIASVTKIEVRNEVIGLGENVLSNLTKVNEIEISETVEKIALNTFAHTNNYSSIKVEEGTFKVSNGMLMDATSKNVYVASTKLTLGDVVLPATVENIGAYAFENSTITSIYIAKNIDIQEGTFYNAKNLKDIISETQIGGKSIGANAFEGCSSLQYVTLSEDIETIGNRAFYGTKKLTDITISKKVTTLVGNQIFTNIGTEAGTDTGKGYVYYYDSNTLMSGYAQSDVTKEQATFIGIDDVLPVVSEVIINEGAEITNNRELTVKVVATDNRAVTQIFITTDSTIDPRTQSVIWQDVAQSYTYTLPKETDDYTLYAWAKDKAGNISALPGTASITLAVYDFELNAEKEIIQYVDTTGKDYYEYRDTEYTLDNQDINVEVTGTVDHKTIGDYAINYRLSYDGKYIETITKNIHIIPNTWNESQISVGNFVVVTHTTGKYAKIVKYTNVNEESELEIPNTFIFENEEYKIIDVGNGTNAISTTENTIEKIILPDTLIAVSDYAFSTFKKLSSIEYENSLMTIGAYAFANSNGIYENITIKGNVREVKYAAFENTIIDEIVIEDGVKSIGSKAFYTQRGNYNDETLNIPASIDNIGVGAFAGYKASAIIVSTENKKYISINNLALVDKSGQVLYQYAIGNGRTEYSIPDGIETIAGYAFSESENLQKVILNQSTVEIGERAFKNDESLKTVENSENVKVLANEAFMNTGIENFIISENMTQLQTKVFKNTKLKNIYVPSSVKQIDSEAFASNTNMQYAVIDGSPAISGDIFKNSSSLETLIALDENTIISINGDVEIPSVTNLYVTSEKMEKDYEADSKWSELGIYRIKCLAELIGDTEVSTVDREEYVELGVKLLEEEISTGNGTSAKIPSLTVESESDVNNEIAGTYHVTYYVKYNGKIEMTLVRTIKVIDETAPVITDLITSETWQSGTNLMIDVIATDNKDTTLLYAITETKDLSNANWSNSSTVTLTSETQYIHVKDKAGNVTTTMIKAWDISANNDKKIFAYEKEDGELVATGTGMTKGYDSYGETPWKEDATKITKLTIEEGIEYLGDYVFSALENVSEISIPSTLGSGVDISTSAFAGTNNFLKLDIASGNKALKVESTYTLVDDESKIIYLHSRRDPSSNYTISSNKETIAENSFYKNNNIKAIDMNSFVNIGASAFEGCLNLESINGEIGNTAIGSAAFSGDVNLKDIIISTSVETLGTGIFTNVPGPVYYYASCNAMKQYAKTYSDETLFIMIDNVGASDTMPTLKSSSSIIMAISNQIDEDGEVVKTEYIIRKDGEEYDESKWQSLSYFTGLYASTKYHVKTRATDDAGNVVTSREATITTKQVPDTINIAAVPAGPTSGDVDVVIEWPIADMEALYGAGWPEGTTVTKQVGIKNPNDASITWTDITDDNATYTHTATENGVTVYARLFDGVNYTAQTISLSVDNIDRIAPTGTVVINDGDEKVYEKTVTLTLTAIDNRNDTGYGVKYYFASENPTLDLSTTEWKGYTEGTKYTFEFTNTTAEKTVYVWFKDAAENISEVCSDTIYVIVDNIMLEQNGETTYYLKLQDAIDAANDNPSTASKITILQTLSQDGPYEISETKNIVIDMNGKNITHTTEEEFELIINKGLLTIMNSSETASGIYATSNESTATGILNYGYVEIIDVSIIADSPDGTSIGIKNENGEERNKISQAIYSADDNSLTFTRDANEYAEGDIYNGKTVTAVYTGFEDEKYTAGDEVPWFEYRGNITSVEMLDEIKPKSTAYWFMGFKNCGKFELDKLNTNKVTDMRDMFYQAGYNTTTFNISDLSDWNVSSVTNMHCMFYEAGHSTTTFDLGDLSKWNVANVTNMNCMFYETGYNATTWNVGDLGVWKTSKVTDMSHMFYNCQAIKELNLSGWDTSSVTTMQNMFAGCSNLAEISLGKNFKFVGTDSYLPTPDSTYIQGATGLWYNKSTRVSYAPENIPNNTSATYVAVMPKLVQAIYCESDGSLTFVEDTVIYSKGSTYNGKAVTAAYTGFETTKYKTVNEVPWYENREKITNVMVVDEITPMYTKYWFNEFKNCSELDLTKLNTEKVIDMSYMFEKAGYDVTTFNIVGLNDWDVSNVTYTTEMFENSGYNATTWNIGDLSNWNVSNVTNMGGMFNNAGYKASTFDIGNLGNWNMSKVTNIGSIFKDAGYSARTWNIGDLSNWDVSSVTRMGNAFWNAGYSTSNWSIGDLSKWDVSNVTSMTYTFANAGHNAETFNIGNLNNWDVSKVTNMVMMFAQTGYNATTWNIGDISNWNISSVTEMTSMFNGAAYNATSFDIGDLSNWNVSNVTNISSLFKGAAHSAKTFNIGNIGKWNVSNVEKTTNMFWEAGYNATTWNIGDLSNWDVSKVTDMSYMFSYAGYSTETFNIGNLNNWNVSKVTGMVNMFSNTGYNATTWNIGQLNNWDVSNVTEMGWIFASAGHSATTWSIGDLSNWNVSKLTNMNALFKGAGYSATTFDIGNIGKWDVSNVTRMVNIFWNAGYNATTWNIGDLSSWDVSNARTMAYMFRGAGYNATTLDIGDLGAWRTSNVTDMSYMFAECRNLKELNLSGWDTSSVTDMSHMFKECIKLEEVSLGKNFKFVGTSSYLPTPSSTYITGANGQWYNKATNVGYAPANIPNNTAATYVAIAPQIAQAIYCESDGSLTFVKDTVKYSAGGTYDGKTVTAVYTGFEENNYTESNLAPWNSNRENIKSVSVKDTITPISTAYWFYMFKNCGTFDLAKLDTSNVTDMSCMFKFAGYNATTWSIGDLSNWDVSNVTDMRHMFYYAGYQATTWNIGDLSNWNVSNVTYMSCMFFYAGYNATTWNIGDLSNWNVSKVTTMHGMFWNAADKATTFNIGNIGNIGNWNVSNVTSMYAMFDDAALSATTFNIGNLNNWNVSNVTDMSYMFYRTGYNATYSLNLSSWNVSKVTEYKDFNTGSTSKVTAPTWVN